MSARAPSTTSRRRRARPDDGLDQPRRRRLVRAHRRRRARPRAAGSLRPARHARRARPGVTLRPPRDDDFDAMLELMNAHQLAAFGEADATAEDLRLWLTTPYVEVENDIRVLERDGRLIGYADVDATREEPPLWWCDVKVDPQANANEVVPTLVSWLEDARREAAFGSGRPRATGGSPARSARSALRRPGTPTGWRSASTGCGGSRAGRKGSASARCARTSTSASTTPSSRCGAIPPIRWTRRSTSGRTGPSRARASTRRSGFSPSRATSSPPSPSAAELDRSERGLRRDARRPPSLAQAGPRRSPPPALVQRVPRARLARGTLGVDASSPTGATRLYERAGMSIYRDTVFLERSVRGLSA